MHTLFDDISNRVKVSAVQIATVLSVLEELVVLNFLLHSLTIGEPIALAVFLQDTWRSGCVCNIVFKYKHLMQFQKYIGLITYVELSLQISPDHC